MRALNVPSIQAAAELQAAEKKLADKQAEKTAADKAVSDTQAYVAAKDQTVSNTEAAKDAGYSPGAKASDDIAGGVWIAIPVAMLAAAATSRRRNVNKLYSH